MKGRVQSPGRRTAAFGGTLLYNAVADRLRVVMMQLLVVFTRAVVEMFIAPVISVEGF